MKGSVIRFVTPLIQVLYEDKLEARAASIALRN
jgi:hypothetical protein